MDITGHQLTWQCPIVKKLEKKTFLMVVYVLIWLVMVVVINSDIE
ncbi:MAG TPA: hypothetical protein PKH98_00045 [Candidatus Omnitrophota bacterium]|nr:hypothetical protein [Candidatus Omnitrophota bacterium]